MSISLQFIFDESHEMAGAIVVYTSIIQTQRSVRFILTNEGAEKFFIDSEIIKQIPIQLTPFDFEILSADSLCKIIEGIFSIQPSSFSINTPNESSLAHCKKYTNKKPKLKDLKLNEKDIFIGTIHKAEINRKIDSIKAIAKMIREANNNSKIKSFIPESIIKLIENSGMGLPLLSKTGPYNPKFLVNSRFFFNDATLPIKSNSIFIPIVQLSEIFLKEKILGAQEEHFLQIFTSTNSPNDSIINKTCVQKQKMPERTIKKMMQLNSKFSWSSCDERSTDGLSISGFSSASISSGITKEDIYELIDLRKIIPDEKKSTFDHGIKALLEADEINEIDLVLKTMDSGKISFRIYGNRLAMTESKEIFFRDIIISTNEFSVDREFLRYPY